MKVLKCKSFVLLTIGFLCSPLFAGTWTYTNIQVPGSTATAAFGLNNKGDVVGWYLEANGKEHGFLLSNGKYTSLDYPGAIGGTTPYGINDAGVIVGNFDNGVVGQGFAYYNGKFVALKYPNSAQTTASGVNRSEQIVGYYIDSRNTYHGFEWQNGTFTKIDAPNASQTLPVNINTAGDISGTYYDSAGQHGFLLHNGTYQTINVPGSNNTTSGAGLNDKDYVVGSYQDPARQSLEGFVTNEVKFQELIVPGSVTTFPAAINNGNVVVGDYFNGGVNPIGFMAKP